MSLNRRNVLTGAAALAASTAIPMRATAADPLNVGMVLIGPVGDFGWSTMHDVARRRMEDIMGDAVATTQVEAVAPPDFDRVVTLLARADCKLIFTTSFSYTASTPKPESSRGL